ncbi:MAG: class I SAM-dependent methyltransferase, partial [Rhodospirillales bacterium]|nr:class I SAM-dependent methyltransferase [Rhodospirillales bacterium]
TSTAILKSGSDREINGFAPSTSLERVSPAATVIMPYTHHVCDVCGSGDAAEIECLRKYTGGEPIHVCKNCGFVYVQGRRSFQEIASAWSDEVFITGEETEKAAEIYTAVRPAIRARLIHVLETIDQEIGVDGKALCDIGAGEGVFLDYARRLKRPKELFGIEPSAANCSLLEAMNIPCFTGAIEDYIADDEAKTGRFDVVTIQWTLECSPDCNQMLHAAWKILKAGGHVVIGTGSRLRMPYKKPLQFYVSKGAQDTHSLRFSPKSLRNVLHRAGFEPVFVNRYIDNDILCMIGRKVETAKDIDLERDNFREIIAFFERWDRDSTEHYAQWEDD